MSRSPRKINQSPITATVEHLSHDGRGLARIDGKATFIQGALDQETVIFQYRKQKRDFDEGRVLSILHPSPHRITPPCKHEAMCGGCSMQHLDARKQIQVKQAMLLDLIARVGKTEPFEVLAPLHTDPWHYRNKARLSVRYVEKKQSTLVGFREKNNPRYIAEIDQCLILNARISNEINALKHLLNSLSDPRMIAQIELAAGDDEIALIFRHLNPMTAEDQKMLCAYGEKTAIRIYLQPAGPESVHLLYSDTVGDDLNYALPDHDLLFHFHPTDFTQVNLKLNRLMVNQALELLSLKTADRVLDLFCGLGNFSLPMAKQCAVVMGVEGNQSMVERARMNARNNGLDNTAFDCLNLDDAQALTQLNFKCDKLLLDPPRAGAMAIVQNINCLSPHSIVYVSCNPATFARDTNILVNQQGYQLKKMGIIDMFPHTAHVESMALFEKA